MRNRISATLAAAVVGLVAWMAFAQVAAVGATAGTLTIGAPTLVQLQSSTHNGGISPACGSHVDPIAGTEGQGVIQDGRGSYIGAVQLPQGATVTSLSLTAHDNTDPGDVFAFLVRKSALAQGGFTNKYNEMASVVKQRGRGLGPAVHDDDDQERAGRQRQVGLLGGGRELRLDHPADRDPDRLLDALTEKLSGTARRLSAGPSPPG